MKVSELKKTQLPQEFLDLLPEKCEVCGADNVITEGLTSLSCSNPFCMEKGVQRLVQLLKDIGVKNLGESKCRSFLQARGASSPYAIFLYNPEKDGVLYDGCSEAFSKQVYEDIQSKRRMPLWEFVRIGNLPNVRDGARKLFSGYSKLSDFYADMEKSGVQLVQKLLAISDKASVKAMLIYETLLRYKDELLEGEQALELQTIAKSINVCISSTVGAPYKSKAEFEKAVHDKYSDKVYVNFLKSLTKDCQYLIWGKDGAPTSKVDKAQRCNIPIVTGAEFEDILNGMGV